MLVAWCFHFQPVDIKTHIYNDGEACHASPVLGYSCVRVVWTAGVVQLMAAGVCRTTRRMPTGRPDWLTF